MPLHRARWLPRQPGPAAWNRLLPPQAPPRPLEGEETADTAIIGAGFAGLSAAKRLTQLDPGLKVVVLEAGRVAEGPAGRNSGFMIDLPHDLTSDSYEGGAAESDRRQTDLNRAAIRFARDCAEEYQMPREFFDPCGKVNAAASAAGDRHNASYAAHLDRMGEGHEMLDAAAMRRLTGSSFFTSGLYTPGTVMLQPAGYVRSLASGLEEQVSIHENSAVLSIEHKGACWRLSTSAGAVQAPKVILANNGHAESFGYFARRLLHIFTYASMTAPLPPGTLGGDAKWGATPADPMGTTVRRICGSGGDRIVVRTRFTCNPSMTVSDAALAAAGRLHERKFAERFPMLTGLPMEYRWAGHLCLSWNGVPGHGEVEEGIYAAVCQNGLGTVRGTLSGISAAELALGQTSEISAAMTAQPAPRRLPPEPLVRIGVTAAIKWKEWRAGPE